MDKNNPKNNNKPASTCSKPRGFTLVETMLAVFILTSVIVGLMTIVGNNIFAARYARNEITASYLAQEAIDYIRNDRDTEVFYGNMSWQDFILKYSACSNNQTGCYFDVYDSSSPAQCNSASGSGSGCPLLYYNDQPNSTPFYLTDDGSGMSGLVKTSFQRKITVIQNSSDLDEIFVSVTVYWKNGGITASKTLQTSLMNW